MRIQLDRESGLPLRQQIRSAIRDQILRGDLAPGDRILSGRELAQLLQVNRTTVQQSYRDLQVEGLIESDVGRGSFVRGPIAEEPRIDSPPVGPMVWSEIVPRSPLALEPVGSPDGSPRVPLSRAVARDELFPLERIRQAFDHAFRSEGHRALGYPSPAGIEPLRRALTRHLGRSGIDFENNELLVVNGSQQGLDLVSRLLLGPGSTVVTSRPAFAGALDVFRASGARIVGVPDDADGLNLDELERTLRNHRPRLLYTVPSFHNPTGRTLSSDQRRALLATCARHQVPLLEDDWLADLRRPGEPLPIKSMDRGDHVLYLGTCSKVLAPGLRIGWLVVPRELVAPLILLKRQSDLASSLPGQLALLDVVESGDLDRQGAALRQELDRRRDCVDEVVEEQFPAEVQPVRPHSGMVFWLELPPPYSARRLIESAQREGIELLPGDPFLPEPSPASTGLRVSYATARFEELRPAMETLARLLREQSQSPTMESGPPLV